MKDQILKLSRRLNKFSLDEIERISEIPSEKILPVLNELVKENRITKNDEEYTYNREASLTKKISKLPLMFQYHSSQTIDLIIKCFCAEISVEKSHKLVSLGASCILEFNKYFREFIYKQQLKELNFHFNISPQIPRKRIFFDKVFYFYNDKNFVSEIELSGKNLKSYSKEQAKYFKIIYSRLRRKLNHNSHAYYTHLHLAEGLWRQNKTYEELLNDISEH